MFGAFERIVAFRYLRARRREGFISVISLFSLLGIGLGVATLIIVMAVMNGFRQELVERILGLNGHLGIYSVTGQPLVDYEPLEQRLAALDFVTRVEPSVQGQALVTYQGGASGAAIRGMRPEDFLARPALAKNLRLLAPDAFAGRDVIAIGARMAERLGVGLGDQLTLIAPQGAPTAFGTMPRMRAYRIVGIFDVGMYEYDNTFVYMPLEAAQIFLQTGQGVTNLEVFVSDPDRTQADKAAIQPIVQGQGRIYDWQEANNTFFTALQVERSVMFIILTLIIVVAAFNIISGLVMLVKDKGHDIAILRTMGATRGMIMRIFLLTGASIGVVGTLAGLVLGIVFTDHIEAIRQGLQWLFGIRLFDERVYFLARLPAVIDWVEVVDVVVMALVLSFLATLYPSWRAARLDPVEALRYE